MLHRHSAAWVAAGLLFAAPPASAQTAGDTLRYNEWTESWSEASAPGGEFVQQGVHDAWITVAWITDDSAHAWYDSISVGRMDAQGQAFPDVSEIHGERFVLRFTPGGDVETLATPSFPATLEGITDLTYQFDDFFVPVPDELRLGVSWTDTITRVSDEPTTTLDRRRIVSFTVAGDTVLDGVSGWLIETSAQTWTTVGGPMEGMADLRYDAQSAGMEDGILIVAQDDGRLLFRSRTAESTGRLRYTGSRPIPEFTTRDGYFSEIVLLRP